MIMLTALAAFAQEAPAVSGSVFDDSLIPALDALIEVATKLEENNVQITDMTIAVVADDGVGVSVPVTLPADSDVILFAIGDDRRIKDLDMGVQGRDGVSGADQLDDNFPRVDLHTTYAGEYTVKVVISEPVEGADKGYFLFITGFPRDFAPVSVVPLLDTTKTLVGITEEGGLRFVHGDLETLTAGRSSMIEATIPQGTFAQCAAFSLVSPDRAKKGYLEVKDTGGNVLAVGKKLMIPQISIATFVNSEENPRHILQLSAKGNGYAELFGIGMVACAPMP